MTRPWPRGYDERLVVALDCELAALAERYDRTLLETRTRRNELLGGGKKWVRHGLVTTTKVRRMRVMREAGEKMEYIACVLGLARQTVGKHIGTRGIGVGRGRMREMA